MIFALSIGAFASSPVASAQTTYFSRATGDWDATNTWSTTDFTGAAAGSLPGSTDFVQIRSDRIVTLTDTRTIATVTIVGAGATGGLDLNGNSLTVTGSVTINNPTSNNNEAFINVGSGTFSVTGSLTMNGASGNNSRSAQLIVGTGTATVTGGMAFDGTNAPRKDIIFQGTGTLSTSDLPSANFTLTTVAGSTIEITGAGTTTLEPSNNYANLVVNKSGGILTTGGGTTIGGNLTITSGTLQLNAATTVDGATSISGTLDIFNTAGAKTFTGLVTIQPGGTWDNTSNEAVIFQGGLVHNGTTFNSGTNTQTFNTNAQVIGGSSIITFSSTVTVAGTTVTNENSNSAGVTITGNLTGSGVFEQDVNTMLTLGGTSTATLTANATGNTVIYNGGGSQTINATDYYNLTISNTNGNGATVASDLNVANNVLVTGSDAFLRIGNNNTARIFNIGGNLSIDANATMTVNTGSNTTHTVTLAGNLTNDGTLNFASDANSFATLTINGTGTQTLGGSVALTLANVNFNNTANPIQVNVDFNSTGTVAVAANAVVVVANGVNIVVTGTVTTAGAITNDGTITVQ